MFWGNNNNSCGCEWIIWLIVIWFLFSCLGNNNSDCGCNGCGC